MKNIEILVIGGGPAGMCAAIEAADCGAGVLVVDDKHKLGGQLVKQTHSFFGSKEHYAGVRGIDIADTLIKQLGESGVEILTGATVTAIYDDGVVTAATDEAWLKIRPEKIIVATGAFENSLPFPNCDLPGVYGAGAVQTLMNVDGVAPGSRVLMVGAGNIGLIVTYQLLQAGIDVAAIVEATGRIGGYFVHANKIRRLGIDILLRHTIKHAWGDRGVDGATIIRIDENFRQIAGTERHIKVDTICLAVGLTPLAELLWNAGCRMRYVAELGGHVAVHDENLRTSREDIYVSGDASGIEEASSAMIEGRIAGHNAACSLSRNSGRKDKKSGERLNYLREQIRQLRRGPFGLKARVGKAVLSGGLPGDEKPIEVPPKPREPVFAKGARVVIECEQNIPCNPCEEICPRGAITVGGEIINYPQLDAAKCNACGFCLTHCPGLALFIINADYSDTQVEISLPYEFVPLPKKGMEVDAIDREGGFVCRASVSRVLSAKKFDRKSIISIVVDNEYADRVRHFRMNGRPEKEEAVGPTAEEIFDDADTIICVCEDVTRREIEEVIDAGAQSFDEIKRQLRTGMGPCQGKTCQRLILRILSQKLGRPVESFAPQTARGPMKPVRLGILTKDIDEKEC